MSIRAPDESLRPALESLGHSDADVARAVADFGLPPVREQPRGFAGLLRIMTSQQLSVASAAAILARLDVAMTAWHPEEFLHLDDAVLRRVGFSRQKILYGRALAEAILEGRLDLELVEGIDDEAAIDHLCQVKGIGRWTSEIYLLFSLKRPDIWPAGDLAVRAAFGRLRNLSKTPSERELRQAGDAWRPHRSAAARLLWHLYRHSGVPVA